MGRGISTIQTAPVKPVLRRNERRKPVLERQDPFDFSLPLNESAQNHLDSNRNLLNTPEVAYPFIDRNVAQIKNDSQSNNSEAFKFFYDSPPHFIGAIYTLAKKQRKCCYWCGEKQTHSKKVSKLLEDWRVDFIRDYSRGGSAKFPKNNRTNCVLVCTSCFSKRYSETEFDSTENWIEHGRKEGFIDSDKYAETKKDLDDIALHRDWQTYVVQEQKIISNRKRQRDLARKIRIIKRAEKFALPLEGSSPNMPTELRRAVRAKFLEAGENSCVWCSKILDEHEITLDHIQTRSHGGSHWIGNMLIACEPCNGLRGDLTVEEYLPKAINPNTRYIQERLELTDSDPRTFHAYWKACPKSYFDEDFWTKELRGLII